MEDFLVENDTIDSMHAREFYCTVFLTTPSALFEEYGYLEVYSETRIAGLVAIFDETLAPHEAICLKNTFGLGCEKLSLTKHAQKVNISYERAKAIREKALRKMRHRFRKLLLIKWFFSEPTGKFASVIAKKIDNLQPEYQKIVDSIEELENNVAFLEYENLKSIHYFMTQDEDEEKEIVLSSGIFWENTNVSCLNFSTRTYNCLKRSGIDTIGKFSKQTDSDLIHVRNLGRKSIMEIREIVPEPKENCE